MGNKIGSLGVKKFATAKEVLDGKDYSGKNVCITGTSSGIGCETARVFIYAGADVFCFNRNLKKTEEYNKKIVEQNENELKEEKKEKKMGKLYSIKCDLADLESIKGACSEFKEKYPDRKIDILFCNAGLMWLPKKRTVQGFEMQIGVNHFGHFVWTLGLLPFMNENSRIQVVSSMGHRIMPFSAINFNDMHYYKRHYSKFQSYGHSKLANIYFANELNRLLEKAGKKIIVNSNHPGMISTNLGNETVLTKIGYGMSDLAGMNKTVQQGASTQVLAATSEKIVKGGFYFDDNDYGNPTRKSQNMEIAKKFFKVSLKSTGIKFPFEVEGEDVNNLEGVKSSLPDNWKELVEKENKGKCSKKKKEKEEEVVTEKEKKEVEIKEEDKEKKEEEKKEVEIKEEDKEKKEEKTEETKEEEIKVEE